MKGFAREVGVPRNRLSEILSGHMSPHSPSVKHILGVVAEALGYDLWPLLLDARAQWLEVEIGRVQAARKARHPWKSER